MHVNSLSVLLHYIVLHTQQYPGPWYERMMQSAITVVVHSGLHAWLTCMFACKHTAMILNHALKIHLGMLY